MLSEFETKTSFRVQNEMSLAYNLISEVSTQITYLGDKIYINLYNLKCAERFDRQALSTLQDARKQNYNSCKVLVYLSSDELCSTSFLTWFPMSWTHPLKYLSSIETHKDMLASKCKIAYMILREDTRGLASKLSLCNYEYRDKTTQEAMHKIFLDTEYLRLKKEAIALVKVLTSSQLLRAELKESNPEALLLKIASVLGD